MDKKKTAGERDGALNDRFKREWALQVSDRVIREVGELTSVYEALQRHQNGDWGAIHPRCKTYNDREVWAARMSLWYSRNRKVFVIGEEYQFSSMYGGLPPLCVSLFEELALPYRVWLLCGKLPQRLSTTKRKHYRKWLKQNRWANL